MLKYTDDKNTQIVLSLLKANGIRKVIASPGTTNLALVASMQYDSWFEMFSSVDERSAAYMACGMSIESNEPVVLTCTGATASRNYFPAITEAYYRKIPVLVIAGSHGEDYLGHLQPQAMDRTQHPIDTFVFSTTVKLKDSAWKANIETNKAILELNHQGGGPVLLTLESAANGTFSCDSLPKVRTVHRYLPDDIFPSIGEKRIAIFIGSHKRFNSATTILIEKFCEQYNALVFTDHTSGYYGKYKILSALSFSQKKLSDDIFRPDLLIHLGEISGEFYLKNKIQPKKTWRVSEDGEIKDLFMNLSNVFQMKESSFFERYVDTSKGIHELEYYRTAESIYNKIVLSIPELPFSNIWIARYLHNLLPAQSYLHFGILNSLRAWNFFYLPETIVSDCNVGGFGIDGTLSTLIGASLVNKDKIYYAILGDLSFFYDINSLGNRHIGNNIRILLINNGCGTEFRNVDHPASKWGDQADLFMAAGGHFGNKSAEIVRHYAQDLGFSYISASSKKEFEQKKDIFLSQKTARSIIFEVFTNSENESKALCLVRETVIDEKKESSLFEKGKAAVQQIVEKIIK